MHSNPLRLLELEKAHFLVARPKGTAARDFLAL